MQTRKITNWEKLALKIESEEWRDLAASIAITVLILLDQHKMSKQQLAEKMGVKPQYVSRVVKGKTNLTLDTIVKLEKALGENIVSVSDPTANISTINAMISPDTVWKNFYHASVKGTAAKYKRQPKSLYMVTNNDNIALAS